MAGHILLRLLATGGDFAGHVRHCRSGFFDGRTTPKGAWPRPFRNGGPLALRHDTGGGQILGPGERATGIVYFPLGADRVLNASRAMLLVRFDDSAGSGSAVIARLSLRQDAPAAAY